MIAVLKNTGPDGLESVCIGCRREVYTGLPIFCNPGDAGAFGFPGDSMVLVAPICSICRARDDLRRLLNLAKEAFRSGAEIEPCVGS